MAVALMGPGGSGGYKHPITGTIKDMSFADCAGKSGIVSVAAVSGPYDNDPNGYYANKSKEYFKNLTISNASGVNRTEFSDMYKGYYITGYGITFEVDRFTSSSAFSSSANDGLNILSFVTVYY